MEANADRQCGTEGDFLKFGWNSGRQLMLGAVGTEATEGHFNIADREAITLVLREREIAARDNVANGPATLAEQMLMALNRVGIVTLGSRIEHDLTDLAKFTKLIEGVVDGRAADFRQTGCGAIVDLLRGEMHMLAFQHLCNHPALSGELQSAQAQTLEKRGGLRFFGLVSPAHQDASKDGWLDKIVTGMKGC